MQLIRDIDLTDYMDVEVEHSVLSAKTWTEQVVDHFYLPLESPRTRLPWKGSHSIFNFRSGEVTLPQTDCRDAFPPEVQQHEESERILRGCPVAGLVAVS